MDQRHSRGQMLIMALLIMVMLLITIPALIFLNQSLSRNGVMSQKRQKAVEIAEGGLSQSTALLGSSLSTWTSALGASNFQANHLDGQTQFSTVANGQFTILCSTGPGTNPKDLPASLYQVRMLSTAYLQNSAGNYVPVRALESTLSQVTVGSGLGNGNAIGAALELFNPPLAGNSYGDLRVHWGPVIVYSSMDVSGCDIGCPSTGNCGDRMGRHPRKFSTSTIKLQDGTHDMNNPPTSDGVNYWANTNLDVPSSIDISSYIALARNTVIPTANLTYDASCTTTPAGSGYISGYIRGCSGPVVFGPTTGPPVYALNSPTGVIYIDGPGVSVTFNQVAFDIAAFITTGTLTMGSYSGPNHTGQYLTGTSGLRVPPTAKLEYPDVPTAYPGSGCPIQSDGSSLCDSNTVLSSNVDFRGFLYVQGSLIINSPGNGRTVVGTVRIGDPGSTSVLQIVSGTFIRIFYDDKINHNICVQGLSVKRDATIQLPAH